MSRQLINSFNGGEFTEELLGRVDLESLRKACRLCRNFIPRTLGGVRRRPGLMRLGAAKFADKKCRLLPFNFSTSARFVLEMGAGYLRFWKDGAPVLLAGVPVEVAAPWTEAQLFAVQMVQVNDLVFFTHPEIHPQELRRVTDTNWTLGNFAWVWPAMRDVNATPATMTPSVITGAGTLTSSVAQFTSGDIGAYYQITHRRAFSHVSLALTTDAASASLLVLGQWELITYGTWGGDIYLQKESSPGVWENIRTWQAQTGETNIQATGRVDKATNLRLNFDYLASSGTPAPRAQLSAIDPEVHGLVKITAVTSSTVASMTVIRDLHAATATTEWAEGAWSIKRGHPRACAIHQQRLVFAGCTAEPQKVWGSALGGFNDFQLLDFDDAAYAILVAAQEANPIVWLVSQDGLIVGTEGDEWLMDSGDQVISATNPPYSKRKTKIGSANVQAQLVGSVVLFVQRGGRAMREYVFAFDEQNYKAPDLTQLADHMTAGGVAQFTFAQNPDSTIWAVTGDGRLLSCTYRRESEVVAWAQHPTNGVFESVATIYGAGDADEVWFSVKRTIGGVTSRHIERFDPAHWTNLMLGDSVRGLVVHFDCATRVVSETNLATVTGLTYLNGATVSVRVDGAEQTDKTVSAGAITLDEPGKQIVLGLPYTSRLQPFLFDTQLPDGTSQGLEKRTPEIRVRLHLTGAMERADSPDAEFYPLPMRQASHLVNAPPPLYTGLTEPLYMQANFQDGTNFELRTTGGEPLNILMVVAQTGIHVR